MLSFRFSSMKRPQGFVNSTIKFLDPCRQLSVELTFLLVRSHVAFQLGDGIVGQDHRADARLLTLTNRDGPMSHIRANKTSNDSATSSRNDYLEKSLDRNTIARSARTCSSRNLLDARSSITSRNRMNWPTHSSGFTLCPSSRLSIAALLIAKGDNLALIEHRELDDHTIDLVALYLTLFECHRKFSIVYWTNFLMPRGECDVSCDLKGSFHV
jgi:hypothetical protein